MYSLSPGEDTFQRLPYPSSNNPSLAKLLDFKNKSAEEVEDLEELYGKNEFDIPIPTFLELIAEHMVAPFFVFQVRSFCFYTAQMLTLFYRYSVLACGA